MEEAAPSPGVFARLVKVHLSRYATAAKAMLKPRFLLKALWRTISRRLFIALFIAPFIYALAAAYHMYLQALAGGWNDMPGHFVQPDQYREAGARWFAAAMLLFGMYGFARGMGFKMLRFTFLGIRATPVGTKYGFNSLKETIRVPIVYESLMIATGATAFLGEIIVRMNWNWRKFLLVAAVAAFLGAVQKAKEKKLASAEKSFPIQAWMILFAISVGLLLSYLYYGSFGLMAMIAGIVLYYRRNRSSGDGDGNKPGGPNRSQRAAMLLFVLMTLSLGAFAAFADDGGWGEYTPDGKKTVSGYLQTEEGQKIIDLGLIAGGFATAGGCTGFLLGGTLGDAFKQALGETPLEGETYPPFGEFTPNEDELPEAPRWQVPGPDGKMRYFSSQEDAQDYCDYLIKREEVNQAEHDYRNTTEQIGFIQSIRDDLARSGRDTSQQDRELERLRRQQSEHRSRVNELGGDSKYKARERSGWNLGEHDEFLRRQKEKRELLKQIHETSRVTRKLTDRGTIEYGEGQTENIMSRLDEWSHNLATGEGKQPTEEELRKMRDLLRSEMEATRLRQDARNADWVRDGTQMTSREIFTGVNADGETSYKSMALRGLLGAATGGQSEIAMEVGDKMYIIHDEVMAGRSGLEAVGIAGVRVFTDELTGRVVETGIQTGGRVGGAGYDKFLKGTQTDEILSNGARKTKDFLNQDVGDALRKGGSESGGSVAARPDFETGSPPRELDEAGIRRKEAFERGREAGRQKVDDLDEALRNHRNNPNSVEAKQRLDEAVDAVQQDKHAMQDLNRRGQDSATREIREGFNRELKRSYEQADLAARQRIADEYGVPVEKVKVVKATNDMEGGVAADPRGFAEKPDPTFETHPDDYVQQKPDLGDSSVTGEKVSYDRDVTYRVEQEGVVDPRTGKSSDGFVDVSKTDSERIYQQEFYKSRNNGELPTVKNPDGSVKLDSNGKPEIDMDEVGRYNREMDQATTDRLDAEAYGVDDTDLQTAIQDQYKGRDAQDIEAFGKTVEHKQYEWQNKAHEANVKADEFRTQADTLREAGDIEGAENALRQAEGFEARAEGLTEEGYRQTTKQYGNQLEARVDAANTEVYRQHHGEVPMKMDHAKGREIVDMDKVNNFVAENRGNPNIRTAEIPPRLTEAVDIMKRTGDPGFSPAEVEIKLSEIGYTPDKVVQQMSSNIESLQKFKGGGTPIEVPDTVTRVAGDGTSSTARGIGSQINQDIQDEILGED